MNLSDFLSLLILIVLVYETYLTHKSSKIQHIMEKNDRKLLKELKDKVESKDLEKFKNSFLSASGEAPIKKILPPENKKENNNELV